MHETNNIPLQNQDEVLRAPDALLDLLADCKNDLAVAGKVLFPDRFSRMFTGLHHEMFRLLLKKPGDPGYQPRKAIAAPRGFGKTSIISMLVPALAVLFKTARYIVPISVSSDGAIEQSENLKMALQNSEVIRDLFGDVKTERWGEKYWKVRIGSDEIAIRPRGAGQKIRGMLFQNYRPDLILVDDLEDPENMDNPDQRKKKKAWFNADVLKAVDNYAPLGSWEIIVLGTILHEDSLLQNLLDSPNWDSAIFEICDDNLKSKIPEWLTDSQIKEIYKQHEEDNELEVFFREFRNLPQVRGSAAAFQQSFFRYYKESECDLNTERNWETICLVDPSRTANMRSAPSGIVFIGINLSLNKFRVRRVVRGKFHPEELYDEIAVGCRELNVDVLGVEITGLHEFITGPLKSFLMKRGIYVEFIELHARAGRDEKGKAARVRTLVHYYRHHLIEHNSECEQVPLLEEQLLKFPRAKDWSLMDPFGYMDEILEKGDRYMTDTPGTKEWIAIEDESEAERAYAELVADEPPALNAFRVFGPRGQRKRRMERYGYAS